MKEKPQFRRATAFFLMCMVCSGRLIAQEVRPNAAQKDLKLVTTGDGHLPGGHKTAVRIYEAPDGGKGQVVYTGFDSLQAAQQLIEEWLKAKLTVTKREKDVKVGGQLASDRILATGNLPKSEKKTFVIIRRDNLECYWIESASLEIALDVEGLIQHK